MSPPLKTAWNFNMEIKGSTIIRSGKKLKFAKDETLQLRKSPKPILNLDMKQRGPACIITGVNYIYKSFSWAFNQIIKTKKKFCLKIITYN